MLAIANIVLPIFALIIAGYFLRRKNILSVNACTELNRYVVWLALPALMIDVMINSSWSELYQPEFFYAFELGVFIIFFGVLAFHWLKTKNLANATVDATSASYANTGFIGLPLCALTFGADKLGPAMIAAILTVSANFAVSIIFIEASSQSGKSLWITLRNVAVSLCKNPLIVAPVIAGILCASGVQLPYGAAQSIKLLGASASPCALVATGLFLAQRQESTSPVIAIELVVFKLVIQPLIVWYLAFQVFTMPPLWAKSAVILSALPTGTGPFMLAELYGKGGGIASRTIFLSTVLGIVTLSICLSILQA
ncbi:AEC family transporter [Oxalobacter aliiformigenes]|uniref:AEC family transporter n=1 Tax=Oxalobacter aliiformigenes TaxID=2946593 RepID=A0ABY7JF70_9BURK|nr:AEC family transporter [Oxalobacter aliiformigenes]WAV92578.1 AEC family transporter [Oxalobacter aliiformigenes]WAV95914.1 AEC family transporter [Oxalobacter aliiformigenes]WAV96294.1 AEC family transporter [Oxalobacter aliiformigenes]